MKVVFVSGMLTQAPRWSTTRNTANGSGVLSIIQQSPPCMPQAQMTALVIPLLSNLILLNPTFSLSLSLFLPVSVKLWCTSRPHSIFTIDAKANVCSVRFHPVERHFLAYGSAGKLLTIVNSNLTNLYTLFQIMQSTTLTFVTLANSCLN